MYIIFIYRLFFVYLYIINNLKFGIMKKEIYQTVVEKSERFLNNIKKVLPCEVESFTISSFGMKKASGYGSYWFIMDAEINGEFTELKTFTHDSCAYDRWTDLEYRSHNYENWVKRNVLGMLENERINDEIREIIYLKEEELV